MADKEFKKREDLLCFWKLQTIVIGAIDSGPMVRLNIAAGACGKGSSPQVKQEAEIREIEKGQGQGKVPKGSTSSGLLCPTKPHP